MGYQISNIATCIASGTEYLADDGIYKDKDYALEVRFLQEDPEAYYLFLISGQRVARVWRLAFGECVEIADDNAFDRILVWRCEALLG